MKAGIFQVGRAEVPGLGFSQQPTLFQLINPKAYFRPGDWKVGQGGAFVRNRFTGYGRWRAWPRAVHLTPEWHGLTAIQRAVAFYLFMASAKNERRDEWFKTTIRPGESLFTLEELVGEAGLADPAEVTATLEDLAHAGFIDLKHEADFLRIAWRNFQAFDTIAEGSPQLAMAA